MAEMLSITIRLCLGGAQGAASRTATLLFRDDHLSGVTHDRRPPSRGDLNRDCLRFCEADRRMGIPPTGHRLEGDWRVLALVVDLVSGWYFE